MKHKKVIYQSADTELHGHLVYNPDIKGPRPAVLVAHAWKGQDDFARHKAEQLAELGYVGFAVDVYGQGKQVETGEDALSLMSPLFLDRKLLRDRIMSAHHAVFQQDMVDKTKIGAIGFCFGGLTVIELLRSGVNLNGVVSFHGVLGNALGEEKANIAPNAEKLKGSLLILHGHEDPLVTQEDITAIQSEFTEAGVDWQMHIYGHTVHAFTNPQANDPGIGLVYNKETCYRSWQTMINFFKEVFGENNEN